ncbi:MAG: hypothetical protein ABIJ37_09320 [Pseudomonadota bacterium]
MKSFQIDDLYINLNKEGSHELFKASYPLRYGRFSEIITPDHFFQLNLNGEIKFTADHRGRWPDPSEYLKRTIANNWVQYSKIGAISNSMH